MVKMKKQSILIVVPYGIEKSGLIIFASRLAHEFVKCGHVTRLIVANKLAEEQECGNPQDSAKQMSECLRKIMLNYEIVLWAGFFYDIKAIKEQIDITISLRTNYRKRIFFIWERTGEDIVIPRTRLLQKLIDWGSDGIIALNNEHVEQLLALGVSLESIHLLPPGVDGVNQFRPATNVDKEKNKRRLGWPYKKVIVLIAGRLVKRKRLDWFLNIWTKDAFLQKNAHLIILGALYGDDPELEELIINTSTFNESVQLIPFKESLNRAEFYRAADFLLLPAKLEGEPTVLSEAMACGLPAVASNIAGHKALVKHSVTGLLFEQDNPESILSAMHMMINNKRFRTKLGRASRKLIMEEREISVVARKYLSFLVKDVLDTCS